MGVRGFEHGGSGSQAQAQNTFQAFLQESFFTAAMLRYLRFLFALLALSLGLLPSTGWGFVSNGRWTSTATDDSAAPVGNPITLTWSIVPDGTTISHLATPSNLVAFLDDVFEVESPGSDYEQRPWFDLLQSSFQRWSDVSGVVIEYEPFDDGLANRSHGLWPGITGVRGDVRVAGAMRDGPGGIYAEAGFIPNADLTLDTSDGVFFGTPGANNSYINLRNILSHEFGHSLGFGHSISFNANFLMESGFTTQFDGPQFDDILGVHYLYGDALEKMGGNNSPESATTLGDVSPDTPVAIGLDATTAVEISPDAVDFVSISNSSDVDYFRFTTAGPTLLDLVLTPVGPTYNEFVFPGPTETIDASQLSDLDLELFIENSNGMELLASATEGSLGDAESLLDFYLASAGSYLVKVTGSEDAAQFYTLSLDPEATTTTSAGDFTDDTAVDLSDYTVWRDQLGATDDQPLLFRGDGIPGVDAGDYQVWATNYGESYVAAAAAASSVPEPQTWVLLALAVLGRFALPKKLERGHRANIQVSTPMGHEIVPK